MDQSVYTVKQCLFILVKIYLQRVSVYAEISSFQVQINNYEAEGWSLGSVVIKTFTSKPVYLGIRYVIVGIILHNP